MGGCLGGGQKQEGITKLNEPAKPADPPPAPPAEPPKPAAPTKPAEPAKPAKQPEEGKLKVGDKVRVSGRDGFEGKILRQTTTDALVQQPNGKEQWVEMEDVLPVASGPPLDKEVVVGSEITTKHGVKGTVLKRTTTEVTVKTSEGSEANVDIEDISFLRVCIWGARGVRNADFMGKSDCFCNCEIEGKSKTKVKTKTIWNDLDPTWDFEAKFVSYVPGDSLLFEVLDEDPMRSPDFLGRAKLTKDQLDKDGGFYGDLPLTGTKAKGNLMLKVEMVNPVVVEQQQEQPSGQGTTSKVPKLENKEVTEGCNPFLC